jgi:3-methyladenine DNA glycosylase AlkC
MAFQVIQLRHKQELQKIVSSIIEQQTRKEATDALSILIAQIRNDIPEKKRISFGRGSIIKELGYLIFEELKNCSAPIYEICCDILENQKIDYLVQGAFLQTISFFGLDDFDKAWPYLKKAATHDHWEMREFAAGWVLKLIEKFPEKIKKEYLKLVKSKDSNLRRFVPESLRPVKENKWFHKKPEYPFSIIKHLFNESKPYPRTSVGNNLSDWMRINEKYAFNIVRELANSGDKNSYWIAYRACRNLVKKEPEKVMDLLGVNEYKYKDRYFTR